MHASFCSGLLLGDMLSEIAFCYGILYCEIFCYFTSVCNCIKDMSSSVFSHIQLLSERVLFCYWFFPTVTLQGNSENEWWKAFMAHQSVVNSVGSCNLLIKREIECMLNFFLPHLDHVLLSVWFRESIHIDTSLVKPAQVKTFSRYLSLKKVVLQLSKVHFEFAEAWWVHWKFLKLQSIWPVNLLTINKRKYFLKLKLGPKS